MVMRNGATTNIFGGTIIGNSQKYVPISNKGDLNVSSGTCICTAGTVLRNVKGGITKISGGKLSATGSTIWNNNGAKITITGGEYTCGEGYVVLRNDSSVEDVSISGVDITTSGCGE